MDPKPARAPGNRGPGLAKGREELYLSGVYKYIIVFFRFGIWGMMQTFYCLSELPNSPPDGEPSISRVKAACGCEWHLPPLLPEFLCLSDCWPDRCTSSHASSRSNQAISVLGFHSCPGGSG